jgi:acyl-CoA synthetase (AMP-forming)/AMP-acid ligase II
MSGYATVEPELFLDAEGFVHTQDGGVLDGAGDLHWTGRLSTLIKTGGANASPLEIEERARRFPGVRSAHAVDAAGLEASCARASRPTSAARSLRARARRGELHGLAEGPGRAAARARAREAL